MSSMGEQLRGQHRRQTFLFSLADALSKAEEKRLEDPANDLPPQEECRPCHGTGFVNGDPHWECDGTGLVDGLTEEDIAKIRADERDDDRRGK